MSQPRMRKVTASGNERPRARTSVAKASGDSVSCAVSTNQETLRSRSKNKIPKSVRYDLENALVGLCDVWFEEIKPHLVRNNIKLHVHGSSASGDHERPPSPAPRALPAPLAPGCTHLDPGAASDRRRRQVASCAGCCSMPPTASRAPCARPHMLNRRPLSPLLSVPQTPRDCTQTQSHNCDEKKVKRSRIGRKHRGSGAQAQASRRVAHLCRTWCALCPAAPASRMRRIASNPPSHSLHSPQSPHSKHNYEFIVSSRECLVKNKATQTEQAPPRVTIGCQWEAPQKHHQRGPNGSRSRSPTRRSLSPSYAINKQERTSTALSQPRQQAYRLNPAKPIVTEELPIFKHDLLDIIGENNDKRVKLLYSSPRRQDYPSVMNLYPLSIDRQEKPGGLRKIPPWR